MLTPEQLKELPERLQGLLETLEDDVIKDIARRIAKVGKITPTADWQIKILAGNAVSKERILRRIAELLDANLEDIEQLFDEAMGLSYAQDKAIYAQAGIEITQPAAMTTFIAAAKRQTLDEFINITRTLAFNGIGIINFYDKVTLDVANAYIASLDKATLDTASGVFSYREAVKRAVKSVTDRGLQTIQYASGHIDRVDVATMRAVRTGIGQTANKTTEMFIEEYDVKLVEVSAHAGARTGEGIANHADWQGGVYFYNEPVKGYKSFRAVTGYGEGAGLGGYNCRHGMSAYFEGMPRRYTDEELERLKNLTVTYNGAEIPLYAATQKQRAIERGIRQTKREILAYDTIRKENPDMVDDNELKRLSMKLKERRAFYKDFSKETGLILRNERTQLEGFGRKEAGRVRAGNISLEKAMNGLSGIETKNGIKVAGVAGHFKERLLGRGVSENDVINTLKNPLHIGKIKYGEKGSSQVFIGNNATIVINPDSGVLISTYPTGRERRKKYGKNQALL